MVGRGVAFEILKFLTQKFNFTVNVSTVKENIIGSSEDYPGSIVEALNTSVCFLVKCNL